MYYFIRLLYPGIKDSLHYMGVSELVQNQVRAPKSEITPFSALVS